MVALIGFAMIVAIVFLLLKGKMSPIVVLTLIPAIAALLLGFGPVEIADFIKDGVQTTTNLLMSVNSPNKKIRKKLLPGAVKHSATLISRQHSLSAENHRNGSSAIINRHQKVAGNAEIQ